MRFPFEYSDRVTPDEIERLWAEISPIEKSVIAAGKRKFMMMALLSNARYSVKIDGRLVGIAFIIDRYLKREMCFVKTEYLTTKRRITYARNIRNMFIRLSRRERMRVGENDVRPLYFNIDGEDVRSREWFLRAGCTIDENGLKCPEEV